MVIATTGMGTSTLRSVVLVLGIPRWCQQAAQGWVLSTLRSVALVLGIPRLMVIGSTGVGTVNTTERCTRLAEPPFDGDSEHRVGYFQHYGALHLSWESPV